MNKIFLLFWGLFILPISGKAQQSGGDFSFWAYKDSSSQGMQKHLDSLFGDLFDMELGLMSNTLFEKHVGGQGQSLLGLKLERKNIPREKKDTSKWLQPWAILDIVTERDTWLNVALGLERYDSLSKFEDVDWQKFGWARNVSKFDEYFVADQYILPLPCNHFPIYVAYWGPGESTLSIDDDLADGLKLEDVLPFMEEQKFHQEAYHGAHCIEIFREVIFDIQTRHADIREINDFVEKLTAMGFRLKVMYPVD